MRFLPRFIYSSGIILRGARGDKYRTVTFRNSLATRDAGSAGGVNRGRGRTARPGSVRRGPRRPSPAPRGHVVPATGPAVRRTANPLERVPARPGRRRAPSGATGTRAPSAPAPARPTRRVRSADRGGPHRRASCRSSFCIHITVGDIRGAGGAGPRLPPRPRSRQLPQRPGTDPRRRNVLGCARLFHRSVRPSSPQGDALLRQRAMLPLTDDSDPTILQLHVPLTSWLAVCTSVWQGGFARGLRRGRSHSLSRLTRSRRLGRLGKKPRQGRPRSRRNGQVLRS